MSGTSTIVSIVFIIGALVLAFSNLRGRNMPARTLFKMGAIWAAIIVGLMLILRLFTST